MKYLKKVVDVLATGLALVLIVPAAILFFLGTAVLTGSWTAASEMFEEVNIAVDVYIGRYYQ